MALSTFSDLLSDVRSVIESDARAAGLLDDGRRLHDGGLGAPGVCGPGSNHLFGFFRH